MPALSCLMSARNRPLRSLWGLLGLWLLLAGCQLRQDPAETTATPPVGHYEGSFSTPGQPELRTALDIRHPSPGHYEAELTVPTVGTLSFVADTIGFRNNQLRLTRPARPGQVLTLTLDGDFWRGTLALDSSKRTVLLVKRGGPTPSTYHVEEVPQANGSAWLFAPADTGTPGAALLLLPEAESAPTAALWADALAREGIIVLVLPATDSAATATESPRLRAALRLLRGTAGADTANVGIWAAGARAGATAQALVAPDSPHAAFFIAQNARLDPASRAAFRELRSRKLPLLGLYGGMAASKQAAGLRNVLSGRRSQSVVRAYRGTGTDLFVLSDLSPRFGPGLPDEIVEWLRGR